MGRKSFEKELAKDGYSGICIFTPEGGRNFFKKGMIVWIERIDTPQKQQVFVKALRYLRDKNIDHTCETKYHISILCVHPKHMPILIEFRNQLYR